MLIMDTRPHTQTERRACALRYFADLAARGAGYELRGVRGWAHADDVQLRHRGYRWAELLATLSESGRLDRELASPPQAKTPSYVYRISEKGAQEARAFLAAPLPPIPAPGPPDGALRIYARPGGRWALEALRDAYRRGPKTHRMKGEPGWLTPTELREPITAWNRVHGDVGTYRMIHDTHTVALIAAGLIEKTHVTLAWGRNAPVVMYRATEAGRTAELLEWYEPERASSEADEPDQ
jgi:hypothetical protein